MKKQVSVFGLHARAALNRLLPVVLGLLVVEGIFAGLCIAHGAALTLSGSNLESALHYSFRAGILALQVLLASSLGSNSRYGYTLQRLRISERCVFLWSCACNALCYAVLWCVQIMAAVGAAFWNAKSAVYSAGPQGVFVDFYRSGFLHGLLPLADGYVWNAQFDIRAGAGLRDRVYAAWNAQKRQPQLAGLHGPDVPAGVEPVSPIYGGQEHGHFPCDYGTACRARLSGLRADADT